MNQATTRTSSPRGRRPELVSLREYARRIGISHVSVIRAVRSGRISTVGGKIDPAVADREWRENTDPSKALNRITGRPRHRRASGEPAMPMDLAGGGFGSDGFDGAAAGYARARAARELYLAQLAKIELDEKRGILVRADEVRLGAFTMARKARDQLIALPERVAAILAATQDAAEVQRILEEEIERVCEEISEVGSTGPSGADGNRRR